MLHIFYHNILKRRRSHWAQTLARSPQNLGHPAAGLWGQGGHCFPGESEHRSPCASTWSQLDWTPGTRLPSGPPAPRAPLDPPALRLTASQPPRGRQSPQGCGFSFHSLLQAGTAPQSQFISFPKLWMPKEFICFPKLWMAAAQYIINAECSKGAEDMWDRGQLLKQPPLSVESGCFLLSSLPGRLK